MALDLVPTKCQRALDNQNPENFSLLYLNNMSGREQKQESYLESFTKLPVYPVVVNTALFAAGVAFIQSPLMEMLVPQL